jgi:hypothetical protein
MANFCTKCGTPAVGQFCTACGAPLQGGGSPPPGPSAPPATGAAVGSASATKVILVVVGVVLLFGAVGVGGLVYVGYRAKQKIAQIKADYGIAGDSAGKSTSGAAAVTFPPPKGDSCPTLPGEDASRILGVAIERVEFTPNGANGSEECRYWVSAAERRRLVGSEIASGVGAVGQANDTEAFEKTVAGALGAVIEAAGDNKDQDFALTLQVYRSRGQAMWDKLETAKNSVKEATGVDFAGLTVQPVEGVGDRAAVLPGGHSIMALKGDAFFVLGFQQFAPGRDKTTALAKLVAGRL